MAIELNAQAALCEKIALAGGSITSLSSSRTSLYDISRQWRKLLEATNFKSENLPGWSEKEELAAETMIATLTYLQRIGCKDIERLLRAAIRRHAPKNR